MKKTSAMLFALLLVVGTAALAQECTTIQSGTLHNSAGRP
jgi:hypothetical protein